MNSFKIVSLPHNNMRFKEWKIRENSKLSYGDAIFIYECRVNGNTKKEKFKSSLNGITVSQLTPFKEDELIQKDMQLFMYDTCTHPIISNEMCGVCGEDLKSQNEQARKSAAHNKQMQQQLMSDHHASVKIVHAEPKIKVSKTEALEIGKKDLVNLVNKRKLVLLVDLDHTVIHTTNDNVSSDLKDIYHYELWQKNVWYHTKFRPNCKRFLDEMSKIYELHMVTFGERSYAHKIASFMDPDKKYFHDRILSRNEIFNPISKTDNLKALFPRGDHMVAIIDDREDVWNYARNLICVQPYVYFKNTGDINDPNKASASKHNKKRKMLENLTAYKQVQKKKEQSEVRNPSQENLNAEENLANILTDSKSNDLGIDGNSVDSTLSTTSNSSTESSSDSNKKNEVSVKKVSFKNKENSSENINNQQKSTEYPVDESKNEETESNDDPDDYLDHLERILTSIHDEYYKIYENRVQSKASEIVELNESDLPDLKRVVPLLKSRILENVVITFSGVVPTDYDLKKQRCYLMATSLGAKVNKHLVLGDESESEDEDESQEIEKKPRDYKYSYDESSSSNTSGGDSKNDSSFSSTSNDSVALSLNNDTDKSKKMTRRKRYTTHLVAAKFGTSKVHEALKSKRKVNVVTPEWLINCNFKWEKCDETLFALTKEYDYKNCSFHNEYNMHQKFAISTKSTVMKTSNSITASQTTTVTSSSSTKRTYTEVGETNTQKNSNVKETSPSKVKRTDSYFTKDTFYDDNNGEDSNEFKMDENLFDQMDKEVLDELDDEDEEGTESEEDNTQEGEEDEPNSDKSSSFNSEFDDGEGFDIDDEMVLALEKNF